MTILSGHAPLAFALPAARLLGLLSFLLLLPALRKQWAAPDGAQIRWAASSGGRWRTANVSLPQPFAVGASVGPTLTLDLPESAHNLANLEFVVASLLVAGNATVAVCYAEGALRFRSGAAQAVRAAVRVIQIIAGAGEEQRVAVRLAPSGGCTAGEAAAAVADRIMLRVSPRMHVAAAGLAVERPGGGGGSTAATFFGLLAAASAVVAVVDGRRRAAARRAARRAGGRAR